MYLGTSSSCSSRFTDPQQQENSNNNSNNNRNQMKEEEEVAVNKITSDAGWGCAIRVSQMLLAQCLLQKAFGREWRRYDYYFILKKQKRRKTLSF